MTTAAVSGQRDEAYVKGFIDTVWRECAANNVAVASAMIARMARDHAPSLAVYCRQLIATQGGRTALACGEAIAILDGIAPALRPIMPAVAPIVEASNSRSGSRIESAPTVEIDPELARIWAALGYAAPLRLWAIARQMTVQAQGSGVVEETVLIAALTAAHCGSVSHLRNIIREGDGLFWHRRKGARLQLVGYEKLMLKVIRMAMDAGRDDLVSTNLPGAQFVAVPYGGNLKQWRAWLYAAWLNSREGHTGNISRYTLMHLFGVAKTTLIGWERITHTVTHVSYAHYTDSRYLPGDYAFPIVLSDGRGGMHVSAMARTSNRYEAPSMRQRQHKRLPRTAYRAARHLFSVLSRNLPCSIIGQPNADTSADGAGFSATGRRYFEKVNARNSDPVVQSAKALRRHVMRHDEDAPHFAYIGRRGRRNPVRVYEQSNDGVLRVGIRLPRRIEDAYFASHGGRSCWIVAWRGNAA